MLLSMLRPECRPHAAEATVGKTEHSERLMKRDSKVCWSRMKLWKEGSLLLNTVVGPLVNQSLIPFPSS